MIGKKINQLATELAPVSTDLTIIGDPISGVSKKITLAQLGAIFSGAVSFYDDLASFPATGDINVIYCAKDTKKLYLWSGSAYVEVFPSQALLDTYQLRSEKGNANGYASLDSGGKVPVSQLPSSIMEYKGMWNAATNTPTLANGTGDTGDVYICNVAGTVNFGAGPLTFAVGDYVIYSGSIWQRSSGAVGTVTSVAASITGDAIGITGSLVTTSGTLALAFSGTSAQYINGAGNLINFPTSLVTGTGTIYSLTKWGFTSGNIINSNLFDTGSVIYNNNATAGSFAVQFNGNTTTGLSYGLLINAGTNASDIALRIQNASSTSEYFFVYGDGKVQINNIPNATTDTDRFIVSDNGVIKYRTGAELLSDIGGASASSYVPYTGATTNVDLGTHTLSAKDLVINHSSGSGVAASITKGGAGEALTVVKSSGSGNAASITGGVTLLSELHLTTDLADAYIASASNWNDAYNLRHNAVTLGTANGLSLSTQVLSLALASGSTTGALSSTDWTTFNNKQSALTNPVTGTGTTNYLPKFTGTSTIGNSAITDDGTTVSLLSRALSGVSALFTNATSGDYLTLRNSDPSIGGGEAIGFVMDYTQSASSTGWKILSRYAGGNLQFVPNYQNAGYNTPALSLNYNGVATFSNIVSINSANALRLYNAANNDYSSISNSGSSGNATLVFGGSSGTMTLSASGNLGLGVTPSAWNTVTAMQIGSASIYGYSTSETGISSNAYYGSGYKYINTGVATQYLLTNGAHIWYNAPSGTAGNAISFTPAMTLNASGRLLLATTTDNTNAYLQIGGSVATKISLTGGSTQNGMRWESVATANAFYLFNGNLGSAGWGLYDVTNATQRFWVQNGGNVGIGTNTPNRLLHLNSTNGDSIIRLTNNSAVITSGQSYGQLEWEGRDGSTGAAGVRGSIDVISEGNLGETKMVFRTSGSNFNANLDRLTLASTGAATFSSSVQTGGNIRTLMTGTTDVPSIYAENNVGSINQIRVFGTSAGGTLFGVTRAGWSSIDTNNGLGLLFGTTDNAPIVIGTNNTERFRIASTGAATFSSSVTASSASFIAANNVTGTLLVQGGKGSVTGVGEINSRIDFGSNDGSVGESDGIQSGGRISSVTEFSNGAYVGMAFSTYQQGRSPDLKEALRITNAGNVGIGTTTPGAKLEVVDSNGSQLLIGYSTTATNYYDATTHIFRATYGGAERLRITSGGNVEINTGSIKTGEPDTGYGRAAVKIGARNTGEAFTSAGYIPVNIDGTVYFINLYSDLP